MTKLLEGPATRQRTGPRGWLNVPAKALPAPQKTLGQELRNALWAIGDFALACVLTTVILSVHFLLYLAAVLAVPLGPFLLPLMLLPVVLLWDLLILGAGKVLALFGLLQTPV